MAYSSYQVQRMVTRLRRARQSAARALGIAPESAAAGPGADRVQLSLRAREQAAAVADSLRLPPGTPVSPATIVDDAPLALPIRIELERRAGSFMRPPLVPAPAQTPIPRARRKREAEPQVQADPAKTSAERA
jgi:hypothetical protein